MRKHPSHIIKAKLEIFGFLPFTYYALFFREHPMFMVKEGNTPILNRCGFPLIIVRYPYNRQSRPRVSNSIEPAILCFNLIKSHY